MIKVDTIYGIDDSEEIVPILKTLKKAIKISKSGDIISLMPGSYDPFQIRSMNSKFELKIAGSGSNTICHQSTFEGFFDFCYENLKLDSCNIISSSSNFSFRDIKFMAMNTINFSQYSDSIDNETKTYITFERCRFEHNFQIIILSGNYVISFKSCEIAGKIPLIFAKRGELVMRLSNTDFENPILFNKDCIVEIQYTCCNFTCPIYQGKESLIISKDSLYGSPNLFNKRLNNSPASLVSDEPLTNKSDNVEYQKEFYGAILIKSDDFSELEANKYTKVIFNTGNLPLTIKLPKEADNGHIITICSLSEIIINDEIYNERNIRFAYIYECGWIKLL